MGTQEMEKIVTELAGKHIEAVANTGSSYAFTVAGFLATIATFLFTLGDKPYFKYYRSQGSFGDLVFLHALVLVLLFAVFLLSILMLAVPTLLRSMLAVMFVSLVDLAVLTLVSYGLTRRAND